MYSQPSHSGFDTWWRGAIARYPELDLAGPSEPTGAEPSTWPPEPEPDAPIDFFDPRIPVARVPMNLVPSRQAPRPRRVRRVARGVVLACGILFASVLVARVATAQSATRATEPRDYGGAVTASGGG